MIITKHPTTKHPTTKNKPISKKAKPRHVVVSKKSRKSAAPDGSDASDIENSSEGSLGSTRLFSPIGFLTVFCSAGLETPITASDSVKRKVIEYVENNLGVNCTSRKSWQELESRDRSMVLRQLNISWSKSFNSWRVSFSEFLKGLLQEPRNSVKFPVRGYVQGMLGLAEGQAFLGIDHPCWARLGKEQGTTSFDLFQSKHDFNNQRETLIITGYKDQGSAPGIAAKRFVEKGLCELILICCQFVTRYYTLM